MTPSVGRIVHVLVNPLMNNGAGIAPAIITRVWNDTSVNYRVIYDSQNLDWITSATLYADEEAARAADRGHGYAAFWPPRV